MSPRALSLLLIGALAACTTSPKPDAGPATATVAAELPVAIVPLMLPEAPDPRSLDAFRAACPAVRARPDRSGLTQPADWATPCEAARTATDPKAFFAAHFTAVRLSDGKGFATGYFEPEIAASRTRAPGYSTPLYRRPADLIEADLGQFRPEWKGRTLRGQLNGKKITPYPNREAIMGGALAGQNLELAWAADANAAFFLEIQGSGRLRLPDGAIMRIGYDSQNGRDYVAIGRVLREQGKLESPITMASILDWLRSHPDEAPAIRAANPSQVFFRELTGLSPEQGPVGALGHPLTPRVSAAVDPAFTPYGAPLLVTRPGAAPVLQIAADTGGAIRGPGRIDMFRGPSPLDSGAAAEEAGNLASPIDIMLLLPNAAAARLQERAR